jgi:hypothetical protein
MNGLRDVRDARRKKVSAPCENRNSEDSSQRHGEVGAAGAKAPNGSIVRLSSDEMAQLSSALSPELAKPVGILEPRR